MVYPATPGAVKGSDTSEGAARTVDAASLRAAVFSHIKRSGPHGATCHEVEVALNMRHQTASARITELKMGEYLRDSGLRRKTPSNRLATVWPASDGKGSVEDLTRLPRMVEEPLVRLARDADALHKKAIGLLELVQFSRSERHAEVLRRLAAACQEAVELLPAPARPQPPLQDGLFTTQGSL